LEEFMNAMRRGQASTGMMVLLVILGIAVLALGGSTTYLAYRDRRDVEELKARIELSQPYIEFRQGRTEPELDLSQEHRRVLITRLVEQYRAAGKDQKVSVVAALTTQQEEFGKKLTGQPQILDVNRAYETVAQEYKKNMDGLDLNIGKGAPVPVTLASVAHLNVPQALKVFRENYDAKAAELKKAQERAAALEKGTAPPDPGTSELGSIAAAHTILYEGKSQTIADLIKAKTGKDDFKQIPFAEAFTAVAQAATALSSKADNAEKAAGESRKTLDSAQKSFDGDRNKLKDEADKVAKDFTEAQSKLTKEFEDAKAAHKAEVDGLQAQIATLKKVLEKRLMMQPEFIRADLILEANGSINQVNPKRRTVLLSIDTRARNKIVPGYRFTVYPADLKLPLIREHEKGKVEVVSVIGGFAEARVIQVAAGLELKEGDRIANPFVGRRVRHVALLGNFDVDQDGHATEEETEQLKRMVMAWGGIVDPELRETTDFLVVGVIPPDPGDTAPPPTAPRSVQDNYKKHRDMNAAKKKADALSQLWAIPVMNQNRLFDLIGVFTKDEKAMRGY
jgi:hypothetical protein